MILRYIIFILLGLLLYQLIKRLLRPSEPKGRIREDASEMVHDQHCGRYVLKRDAFWLGKNGENLYFCSEECLHGYRKKAGS
jgi:YHS domain-containing protein